MLPREMLPLHQLWHGKWFLWIRFPMVLFKLAASRYGRLFWGSIWKKWCSRLIRENYDRKFQSEPIRQWVITNKGKQNSTYNPSVPTKSKHTSPVRNGRFLAQWLRLSKLPYASIKTNPFTHWWERKYLIRQFPFLHLPNSVTFGLLSFFK